MAETTRNYSGLYERIQALEKNKNKITDENSEPVVVYNLEEDPLLETPEEKESISRFLESTNPYINSFFPVVIIG